MRRIFFTNILFIFLIYASDSFSQPQPAQIDVFPPSPTASSLGKFADIPVGYYTGTPIINIPIWTVKSGDIVVPVSLSYHAGGIQVAEIASWVGIGWALNAGGVITRTERGLPDDGDLGFLNTSNRIPTTFKAQPPGEEHDTYIKWASGAYDSQPDLFTFNFGARTGKFQFDQDGVVYIAPFQKIKIIPTYRWGKSDIIKWEVTTEDGFKYTFDKMEKSRNLSNCNPSSFAPPVTPAYTSSWYLTSILSTTNIEVKFTYDNVTGYTYQMGDYETNYDKITLGAMPQSVRCASYSQITEGVRLKSISSSKETIVLNANTARRDLPGENRLDNIEIKDYAGNIVKRFDMAYQYMEGNYLTETPYSKAEELRLTLLKLTEKDGTGVISNPSYSFEYDLGLPSRLSYSVDHWGYYNGIKNSKLVPTAYFSGKYYDGANRGSSYLNVKGTLKKINYPTGGSKVFTYETNRSDRGIHKTEGKECVIIPTQSSEVHAFTSITKYFTINDPNSNTVLARLVRNTIPCTSGGCECGVYAEVWNYTTKVKITDSYYNCTSTAGQANADLSDIIMELIPGNTYTLVVKAKSSAVFPMRYFDFRVKWDEPVLEYFDCGGLRVKQIDQYERGQHVGNRTYEYISDNGNPSGRMLNVPNYSYLYHIDEYMFGYYYTNKYFMRTSTPNSPLNRTQGSPVGYGQVTENINGVISGTTVAGEYGKTVRKYTTVELPFSINEDYWKPIAFPFAPANYFDWIGGYLLEEINYKKSGSTYKLVNKIKNEYTTYLDPATNTNVRNCIGLKLGFSTYGHDSYRHIYSGKYFEFKTCYAELKRTTETKYDDNNEALFTTVVTDYTYSKDHLNPIKEEQTLSDNSKKGAFYIYPSDYLDNSGFIYEMKLANNINKPIEKVYYIADNNGGNIKIIGGEITKYKPGGKGGLKDVVYNLETSSPIPFTSFRISSRGNENVLPDAGFSNNFFLNTSIYTPKINFNSYDAKGNLLQYTKDGRPTSFVWGYNNNFPIAEVQNAVADQVFYESFENNINTSVIEFKDAAGRNMARTGQKVWSGLIYTFAGFTPPAGVSLKMSYWYHNGAKWNFSGIVPFATSVNITGQGQKIDEIRVFPANSLIKTYAYRPLIGVTSEMDESSTVTSYEYDNLGRLKLIKDHEGNVMKSFSYKYQGQ